MFINGNDSRNSFGLKVKGSKTKNKIQAVKDATLQRNLQNAIDIFCKKTQEKGIRGGFEVLDINTEQNTLKFNIINNIIEKGKEFRGTNRFGNYTQPKINKSCTTYVIDISELPTGKKSNPTLEIVKRLFKALMGE